MDREKIIESMYNHSHRDEVNGGETLHDSSFAKVADGILRSQWISVEDRLPEPYSTIMYYNALSKAENKIQVGVCGYKEWWSGITHWQPLPEAPEDK